MKLFSKMIALLILASLILVSPLAKAAPAANMTHRIAGYGPTFGEYVMPKTLNFFNKKIYIQDQFGISIIDQVTRHLDNRFPIDTGSEKINQHWDNPNSWLQFLKGFSSGMMGMMNPGSSSSLLLPGFSNGSLLKSKICFDSTGNLYVSGINNLQVYNASTGKLSTTIAFPQIEAAIKDTESPTSFSYKIYQDKIFLLESKSNMDPTSLSSTAKMYIFSLTGELQQEINFTPNPDTSLYISGSDFFYSKDLNMIGLSVYESANTQRLPIQFFDFTGKEIPTTGNLDQMVPSIMEIQEPARILMSGLVVSKGGMGSFNSSILIANLKKNEDGSVELIKENILKSNKFGMMGFDIATDGTDIGYICSGPMEEILDCRIYHIVNQDIQRLGSFPNKPGQIFGSIASTVDNDGNLYETSIGNPFINKYDKQGKFVSQIKMNLKEISSIMGLINIFPTIMSLEIKDGYLYCTNLFPNSLSRYSFKDDTWEKLFEGEMFSTSTYMWFSTIMADETLYLLDSGSLNEGTPGLSYLDVDNTPMPVSFIGSPAINEEKPPVFINMIINDKEMQFLDCANNEIWIYTRSTETYLETIKIPTDGTSFFTSFDEQADHSWILSDVIQNRLIHLSRKGALIETIGSKGILSTGNAKEDYEKMTDQFYRPIHVNVMGNLIYVSDLMNCRYHIISPEKKPELIWNEEEVMINDFSVFEQKTFSLSFQVASSRDFAYTVSSDTPFIKLEKAGGMVSEKKINYTILGDKLTAWQSQQGVIKVSFPDYPSLNRDIKISVKAVGKVVKLTIGSEKALFNGKEVDMGKGAAPMIKKGRTFVGIRFLGETIFNAKVGYEAKTRTVTFELGNKKIELYIDQPYAVVNGAKVTLDAPPFIQNGRTLVPLRFISENLEATVEYEAKTQSITISYPKK